MKAEFGAVLGWLREGGLEHADCPLSHLMDMMYEIFTSSEGCL